MKFTFAGDIDTLITLRCGEWRLSHDVVALLVIILLGVVGLSLLALFFGGETTSTLSRFVILTSSAEPLSLLLPRINFRELFLNGYCTEHINWRESFPLDYNNALLSTEVFFRKIQLRSPASHICPLHPSQKNTRY